VVFVCVWCVCGVCVCVCVCVWSVCVCVCVCVCESCLPTLKRIQMQRRGKKMLNKTGVPIVIRRRHLSNKVPSVTNIDVKPRILTHSYQCVGVNCCLR